MTQKKPEKIKKAIPPKADGDFTTVVKIMANTQPISNEEIVKRGKKRK